MRLATLAFALLATGCAQTPRVNVDPESGNVDVDVERVGTGETWTGNLSGVGMPSVTGTATVRVTDDMSHATVSLAGGSSGRIYPWHVHEGSCGSNGAIVGDPAVYPPLRPGSDGRASAQAHLMNLELNEAKSYYVNVHASPTDLGTIVACGAIDD